MRTLFLCASVAAGSILTQGASSANSASLWPTQDDKAICNYMFSKLDEAERGTLIAQAQPPASYGDKETKNDNPNASKVDESELTTQLSEMLQACSYDGRALKVDASTLKTSTEANGTAAVSRIMRYTGLPQNFTITESAVPNAAALIVMGQDGIPKRVIAYNRQFMQEVASATGDHDWSGTSILAHEIGHHLSGHTLLPGGSKPPIELEADKFSGFVLFKMGATLPQAEKAIATLIPQADGPTHPGRKRRLDAVKAGWAQSCEQQRESCGDDQSVALAEPSARHAKQSVPEAPTVAEAPAIASDHTDTARMPDIPGPFDDMPSLNPNGGSKTIGPAAIDRLPKLSAEATPSKFDRFVYDEAGVFDPLVREKLQAIAFQFAAAANVEVVTLAIKDLQGRDPDRYALDFMRQMRVGKLDVGNGAVLVVAPDTKQVGVALGPGLQVLFENDDSPRRRLQSFVDQISQRVSAQKISSTLAGAAYRVMNQSKPLEWSVRYPSFADYDAAKRKNQTDRASGTIPFDPAKD